MPLDELFISRKAPPLLSLFLPLALTSFQSVPTSPEEHLGRPLGRDFELADWGETSSYYRRLAEESPRVLTEQVGTTTDGRDFLLSTISSEANLARLDEWKRIAARLADPRGLSAEEQAQLVQDGRVIVFISCAMHATETAAPQWGMEFAHELATSDEEPFVSARENLIVLIAPSLNPDGQDLVVNWYRETVGTPYEATGLLELYQRYAGHDNNRDWFALTQVETRIVTSLLYDTWHPQVYWDVHQQGSRRERFFVPPFRDPLNPNLEPLVITAIDELGTRALFDMTRAGLTGISTGVSYDMWWNGGNRNVPVRHNIVGLLTEAASVDIASPIFLSRSDLSAPRGLGGDGAEYAPSNRFPDPWPGGWWRIRDIINYEHAFGRSLIGSLSRERELWLQNAAQAARESIAKGAEHGPHAWLLPPSSDRGAAARLVSLLTASGVELEVASETLLADGRSYPAGTIVIDGVQPYSAHVKDLFEVQRYPAGDPPYDVAGWTLPLLFGVRRVEVVNELEGARAPLEMGQGKNAWLNSSTPEEDLHDPSNSEAWRALFARLAQGGEGGEWLVDLSDDSDGDSDGDSGGDVKGPLTWGEKPATPLASLTGTRPRIGLYAPWSGVKAEGWTRWVFDEFGVPYLRVRPEMLRAGELSEFLDVLVLPGLSGRTLDRGRSPGSVPTEYSRGLAPEGAVAVEEFVREGGTLVALGRSSAWAADLLRAPLVDVTRSKSGASFSCPGSVLRLVPESTGINTGIEASIAAFFSNSSAWRTMTKEERGEAEERGPLADDSDVTVHARWAPQRVLLSGWIEAPEVIAGRAAWCELQHGEGRAHLFSFRPQYRGWSQDAFELLFRAIVFGGDTE